MESVDRKKSAYLHKTGTSAMQKAGNKKKSLVLPALVDKSDKIRSIQQNCTFFFPPTKIIPYGPSNSLINSFKLEQSSTF